MVPSVSNPLVEPIIREGKLQSDRTAPFLFAKKNQCKLCTIYSCPLQRLNRNNLNWLRSSELKYYCAYIESTVLTYNYWPGSWAIERSRQGCWWSISCDWRSCWTGWSLVLKADTRSRSRRQLAQQKKVLSTPWSHHEHHVTKELKDIQRVCHIWCTFHNTGTHCRAH